MIVDTHTHLYLPEFDEDATGAVERAIEAGVGMMLLPNVGLDTVGPMHDLNKRYPDSTCMAMGLHPTEVGENYVSDLRKIESELIDGEKKYVAVGEIGIDLYWDKTYVNEQIDVFSRQVDIAVRLDLPVIIHCRDGLREVLDVLRSKSELPRAVFHSFGGSAEDVASIREVGDFYFGINGIVTFKNSRLREVLPVIGADRILLETDSPYLAPVPFRGKRNESAYIVNTALTVADALGLSFEEICDITTRNAFELFKFKQ